MDIRSSEGQFQFDNISLPDDQNYFTIVGGNNSGKSTFLREVVKSNGHSAYRIDVNRTILKGEGSQDKNYERNLLNYLSSYNQIKDDNSEKPTQVLQDFFRLKDVERKPILDWYNQYFPSHIYEEREDPENSASAMFLKVGGYPITRQGSGMRATLEIFIKLFDPAITFLCIDEPEIGLEPYLQKYLFQAIKDKASASKKIFIATHSHHFLDTDTPSNNYVCERNTNNKIVLSNSTDLKSTIFRLLGNTLSSFLLPERLLILEGPSDTTFLLTALKQIGKDIYSIHNSRGIGNVSYAMKAITEFLRFNQRLLSVYRDKIHVIVDRPGKDILIREWKRIVPNPDQQICILSKNGIEYYYPERILQQIFEISAPNDYIIGHYLNSSDQSFNGIRKSKTELSEMVASLLQPDDLKAEGNELFEYLRSLPHG